MTSENKFTPGPWEIYIRYHDEGGIPTRYIIPAGKKKHWSQWIIACVDHTSEDPSNARLIAAAPELLEALQLCITSEGAACFGDIRKHQEWMQRRLYEISDIARAAIAKATRP